MATLIEKGGDITVLGARDDDRVLTHEGRDEVPRVWDLGLVRQEEPITGENAFEFEVVDLLAGVYLASHHPGVEVNQPIQQIVDSHSPSRIHRPV